MGYRSFRLRIALFTTLLAGSAVVGFSSVAWRWIYVAKVSRLDAKLENQVRRSARPRPPHMWATVATDLSRDLGIDSETATALRVLDAAGDVQYQSQNWSAAFNPPNLSSPHLLDRSRLPVIDNLPDAPSTERADLPGRNPYRSLAPSSRPRVRPPSFQLLPPEVVTRTVNQRTTHNGSWRVGAASFPQSQVVIAVSLDTIGQEMAAIRNIFLVAIPGTLLLVASGAWWISRRALRPIQQITTAMQQVSVNGLDQRVPMGTMDIEFVELIQVFNRMLERLERSFKQASRFSADAAHELKTPLAILQGELELALQHAPPASDLQQNLSSLLEEVNRLSGIVRKLLLLSLADAGQMGLHKLPIDLSELLTVMVEDLELLAPHLEVQTEIASDLTVWGDRDLLTQVLQNLISNAIKYNRPQGWINIQARQHSAQAQMTITNASEGIPAGDRDRIFDRFYRSDPARSRTVEGIGLGLSLAREIVRAHQGNLTLDATLDDRTTFTLMLPS